MSRLIKADEAKRAFIGNRYGTKAIEYVIDNVPTVEAIPIEWIRKWNIRNYPYTALLMSEIIPKMIEDWEKEKGIDKDMPHELLSEREKRALQETVDWVRSWLGDDAVVGISYTKEDWEEENEID